MKKFVLAIAAVTAGLWAAPCIAQTYYVAANGTGEFCSPMRPCATLSTALNIAGVNATIICLTPPAPGAITIIKSVTIDCSTARGPVRDGFVAGEGGSQISVYINAAGSPLGQNTDLLRTVRLRGLTLEGGAQPGRSLTRGIEIASAAAVYIEDSIISNYVQQGIYDHRTGGGTRLYVKDTIINGNGGPGIVAAAQGGSSTVLDNVSLLNNLYGVAAATGNNVVVNRSTVSGNLTAGIHADAGAQINVLHSVLSHNAANVNAYGTVRLQENAIQFSNVAIQGGAARSAGANRFLGNVSLGSTPPLVTGAPADVID